MKKLVISYTGCSIGADPELFIVNTKGKRPVVVGSETIIKKPIDAIDGFMSRCGTIETDGVQVELHPKSSSCRQSFSYYLNECLLHLHEEVAKHPDLAVSLDSMVTVRKDQLIGLSDKAKFLGCSPSKNFYGRETKEVNGMEYRRRSAAGHIHIGSHYIKNGIIKPNRLVPALDILVGIPSVLMDRDPKAAERRKLYGRAGEWRPQPHGLEYRTLSNFWLISYKVGSLVTAQAKNAMAIAYTETQQCVDMYYKSGMPCASDALNELILRADLERVEKAINKNDFDLAYRVYEEAIKPVMEMVNAGMGLCDPQTFSFFETFIKKPLKEWFPNGIIKHWSLKSQLYGWESFAQSNGVVNWEHL